MKNRGKRSLRIGTRLIIWPPANFYFFKNTVLDFNHDVLLIKKIITTNDNIYIENCFFFAISTFMVDPNKSWYLLIGLIDKVQSGMKFIQPTLGNLLGTMWPSNSCFDVFLRTNVLRIGVLLKVINKLNMWICKLQYLKNYFQNTFKTFVP